MVAAIDAKRGQVWVQAFGAGGVLTAPAAMAVDEAVGALERLGPSLLLVGSGGPLLTAAGLRAEWVGIDAPDPAAVARLTAAVTEPAPPRPLYLRAPDARLPA